MKENIPLKKTSKEFNTKPSTTNLFLNIIILLLSAIIIFMSYSLVVNLTDGRNSSSSANGKKAASIIQVEVLNGCGVSGAADKFTNYLRQHNFDVVQMGNYISFDIEKTLVIDRTGNMADAYKVAEVLGVSRKNVIQQTNKDYFLDVSVVIGKDFNQLKPNN